MKISDEDAKLLFDTDQISARLDILFANYLQAAATGYTGENIGKVESDTDSLKENVVKALAGVDNLNMCLVSMKASVAQLIAQNNRTLLSIFQHDTDSPETHELP